MKQEGNVRCWDLPARHLGPGLNLSGTEHPFCGTVFRNMSGHPKSRQHSSPVSMPVLPSARIRPYFYGNSKCFSPTVRKRNSRIRKIEKKKNESTAAPSVVLRPAGSDPEVVCQKDSFLKVSVSLGGFGPSVAHGKHSVRRRCVQATKNKAETCSLLDAIGRRSRGRWSIAEWV